jgi:acyl-CoA thioester hydrolase
VAGLAGSAVPTARRAACFAGKVVPIGHGPVPVTGYGVASIAAVTTELGRETRRKPPFKYSALARVWFSDTDAQGIVYYGRYLPYFDHARVEYHRHLDLLAVDPGVHEFVMRASTVEYLAPARFDDLLEIFVRLRRIGRTSATYECAAYRVEDDTLMCTAEQTLVLVDLDERRAAPIPESFSDRIRAFEGADLELATPA